MWQRIQTLYLAIAFALSVLMLFMGLTDKTAFTVLIVVIAFLQLIALTTYKIRIFQMRTCVLSALICVALQAWIAIDFFRAADRLAFDVSAVFPVIIAILDVLSARKILFDEVLVRGASRLRSSKKR